MPFDFPYDDWADIYDAVYADLTHDVDFYAAMARESGGPILELGCGTGRISLAIAREGVAVTGVDISPRMIAVAQAVHFKESRQMIPLQGA
jgi:2-polyprenyl-3-methyl-5-hydroxy-6-metoxy-1,4-benzoquinol methylase